MPGARVQVCFSAFKSFYNRYHEATLPLPCLSFSLMVVMNERPFPWKAGHLAGVSVVCPSQHHRPQQNCAILPHPRWTAASTLPWPRHTGVIIHSHSHTPLPTPTECPSLTLVDNFIPFVHSKWQSRVSSACPLPCGYPSHPPQFFQHSSRSSNGHLQQDHHCPCAAGRRRRCRCRDPGYVQREARYLPTVPGQCVLAVLGMRVGSMANHHGSTTLASLRADGPFVSPSPIPLLFTRSVHAQLASESLYARLVCSTCGG